MAVPHSMLLSGREYATLESVGFYILVLSIFTSCCLLVQILVICYFLVVYYSVTARKFYLLGCGRNISASCISSEKEVDLIV